MQTLNESPIRNGSNRQQSKALPAAARLTAWRAQWPEQTEWKPAGSQKSKSKQKAPWMQERPPTSEGQSLSMQRNAAPLSTQ
mmetsp:Transcript_22841/g.56394  ORF Transcript_22841/g.56394 Transcript_22841/m.56394 type:complete len:82 (-) Transcript_22841:4358-4603(-)